MEAWPRCVVVGAREVFGSFAVANKQHPRYISLGMEPACI